VNRARALLVGLVVLAVLSGCGFNGIQSLQLPGDIGTGKGSIKVTVELPDVGTLTPNAQVKVDDIAVGTVTKIRAVDWHAVATISLKPSVKLPANAVARVGINSLLGASYLELAPPPSGTPAQGTLVSGARIPLSRTEAYPATEQVLSAASVVLNGGGLEQLSTITSELSKAFNGNDMAVRDLLPRVNSFVSELNAQKTQIYGAIDSLDRLSVKFADNRGTLTRSIDQIGPALATLSKERPKLTAALTSLKQLSDVATPLVEASRANLVADLRDLVPTLKAVSSAGDSLVRGLGFAVTFPFAPETVANACRGDYCNLDLVLDLTNESLVDGFTDKNGLPSIPGLPGFPSIPQLVGLLTGVGLGPVLGGLGNLVNGLTSPLTGSSNASATKAGTTKTSATTSTTGSSAGGTKPTNGLSGLLASLLGGGAKGATP
jgi:phospholipid/cholesterol/gamma-HCH transport system substrate-binding protein